MKPIILLDCDGVLADFISTALQVVYEETGHERSSEEIKGWDVFESLGYPELWDEFMKRAARPGFCAGISPYSDAPKGVKNLRKRFDVRIVTAPLDVFPWMPERARWLEEHFDIPKKHVIFAHEKHLVSGAVFVDDKPEHVESWSVAHPLGIPVIWDQPYNRKSLRDSPVLRTNDWDELSFVLKRELER